MKNSLLQTNFNVRITQFVYLYVENKINENQTAHSLRSKNKRLKND